MSFSASAICCTGDSDAALLARALFDHSSGSGRLARTLLLSATPYRMLTLSGDDPVEGDHYRDFLETLEFLYGREIGGDVAATLHSEMLAFRGFLHGLPGARLKAAETRERIEGRLKQVIARTERVSSTAERDSMVRECLIPVSVRAADLREAALVSAIARLLEAPEIIEYWKSAPYLLNFMRDYTLKRAMVAQLPSPSPGLLDAIARATPSQLDRKKLNRYAPLDPANGRMRALMDDVFRDEMERNLWIPPALPYYGPPRLTPPLTKALVFSSWSMVPDAIAAILTYEAERRMGVGESGRRYFDKTRPRPLQFRQDDGGPTGMRQMLLIYPSSQLAKIADPLAVIAECSDPLSIQDMRAAIAARLRPSFEKLKGQTSGSPDGNAWEWAAPAAMDANAGSLAAVWLQAETGLATLASEDGFQDHLAALRTVVVRRDFGPVDDGILDLLVTVALGSPAVCALRALHRIAPELAWTIRAY
ncbi:MAG: hypothetical protein WDO24_14365 [Pseudomonadota bacterium]